MSDQPNDETIVELMSRDPLELADQNIDDIIKYIRGQRSKFLQGNKSAGTPAKRKSKTTKAQEAAQQITGQIKLDF